MKIGPAVRLAFLLCLGMTPQIASAARPVLRARPLGLNAPARVQGSAKIHQATGEVLAASASRLLLLHARGWAKQKMSFTLTPQTEKAASLSRGERIVVFYREIGGRRIAARIRTAPPARRRKAGARVHQATGEVISASADRLLLLHARGRGERRMTFTLTPHTSQAVGLRRGERIVVFYREVGGHRIAARIRAASPSRRAPRARPRRSHS